MVDSGQFALHSVGTIPFLPKRSTMATGKDMHVDAPDVTGVRAHSATRENVNENARAIPDNGV